MKRRSFLKRAAFVPALGAAASLAGKSSQEASAKQKTSGVPRGSYSPGRIPNEFNLFLSGEREALKNSPRINLIENGTISAHSGAESKSLKVGESIGGWQLVAILPWLNGVPTVVFEKHVTHQGAIAYVTAMGEIANVPKRIGDLSKIRPRPVDTPHGMKFDRPADILRGRTFLATIF